MEWKDRQTGAFMGQEQNAIHQAYVLVQGTQKPDETSTTPLTSTNINKSGWQLAILEAGRAGLVLFQSVDSTWHIDALKENWKSQRNDTDILAKA